MFNMCKMLVFSVTSLVLGCNPCYSFMELYIYMFHIIPLMFYKEKYTYMLFT